MRRRSRGGWSRWLVLLGLAIPRASHAAGNPPSWAEQARSLPTPAWAQGADALVLEDSEGVTVSVSGGTLTRTRWAARMLAPTGAGALTRLVSYMRATSQVRSMDAWEASPDGIWTHRGDKDAIDFSATGAWSLYSDVRCRALSAWNPVPGTVFAFESVVEDLPLFGEFRWSFDGAWPSLHSVFSLKLPSGVEPIARTGAGREPGTIRDDRSWTWELGDLPARASEPMAPSRSSDGSRLFVSLSGLPRAQDGTSQVAGATFRSWPEVSQWLYELEAPQCVVTPTIRKRVQALLGTESDTLKRLARLARDVQRTNYVALDLGLANGWGYRPHPAEEVLAAGYGDCKDKANLLCALVRAAGHDAWMVSAYSGSRHFVDPDRPTPSQFNHCIVAMRVPEGSRLPAAFPHPTLGTVLAFDPTDPLTEFGDLPEAEQGSLVLFNIPGSSEPVRLPLSPPESRRFERTIRATLSDKGELEAHVEERCFGQAAVPERQLRRESTAASYRRTLERSLAADRSSVELKAFRTEEDSLQGSFRLSLDFAAPGFARPLGATMLSFRPAGISPRLVLGLPDSERKLPIAIPAECSRESVMVAVPERSHPEELPAPVDHATDFGSLHAEWSFTPGMLLFVRTQTTEAILLPAERYAEVRAFYSLSNKVRNTPVVLLRN
jgi:hypothetical protein